MKDGRYRVRQRSDPVTALVLVAMMAAACAPNPADDVKEAKVGAASNGGSVGEAAATGTTGATSYLISEGSKIEFVGSKVTGSHAGGFKRFDGRFTLNDGRLVGSDNRIVIDMASTWSDTDRLTNHLKSPDFFDTAKYPTATYVITKANKLGETDYEIGGDLTLHGVTRGVTFPATLVVTGDQARLTAEFFIKRFDFDIRYPGKPDDLIREEVVIKLDLEIEAAA